MKLDLILLGSAVSAYSDSYDDCPRQCHCYGARVDCSNRQLTEMPDRFPENTRSLDLSGNQLKEIREVPEELSELTELNLSNNKIQFIEYDAFDNLDELLNLDLSNNKLQDFEDDVFEWNPLKLQHINLSNNLFESVQHFLFYDLNNLETIDLSHNRLAWIHPHAFDDSEKLTKLDLSNNKLTYFKYHWIQKVVDANLAALNLQDNDFQCDCSMKDDGNFLADRDKVDFLSFVLKRGQSGFSGIDCKDPKGNSFNLMDYADKTKREAFIKAHPCIQPKITGISRDSTVDNGKTLLLKCITTGQPQPLVEWKAPNGDIYRLQSTEFEGITVHGDGSLLIEDIRKNDGGDYECRAHNSLGEVTVKTEVTVRGDDPDDVIERDDEEWDDGREGNYFDLDDKTWSGTSDFHEFEVDHDLDEDDEEFRKEYDDDKCPRGCTCSTNVVDCGQKDMTNLPSKPLPKAGTHLDMHDNKVSHLDRVCDQNRQLRELKMDHNDVTMIEERAFDDCHDMVILTLRHNKLTELTKDTFYGLSKIQILVLDNNMIRELPDEVFSFMKDLEYLYIRENDIHFIAKDAFKGLPSLRYVHLENNNLNTLKRDWIEVLSEQKSVKRVFLADNKIVCDDRIAEFSGVFDDPEHRIFKVATPNDLKCAYPAETADKFLHTLNYRALPKSDGYEYSAESESGGGGTSGGFIFLGILIGAVLAGFGIIAWRKWNRRNGMSSFRHISYTDVSQEQEPLHSSNRPNGTGGQGDQELFI